MRVLICFEGELCVFGISCSKFIEPTRASCVNFLQQLMDASWSRGNVDAFVNIKVICIFKSF